MNQGLPYQCQRLSAVLNGCLNNNTVYQSEEQLKIMSNHPQFINQLLNLIPFADKNIKSFITTTLKNYLLVRYNSNDNPLSPQSKQYLRNNLFTIFYQIYPQSAPIKVFKQVMHIIILVDYPWNGVHQIMEDDLNNSIIASVYFFRQVTKAYQYETLEKREGFEHFISQYFPRIENIIRKILNNYNQETSQLLFQALKGFYSAFHIQIPEYLRNFNNFDLWLQYLQTILNVPSSPISIKNQEMVARIYLKLFMLYANDAQDGKQIYRGWAAEFRKRYCQRIFQHVVDLIGQRKGNEDILSNLVNCLYEVVKRVHLRQLFTNRHCQVFLYQNQLLPLCQSSNKELLLFKNDPIEYVHRSEDLTCQPLRRSILDLIQMCASCLSYNNKSQMIRILQRSAIILQSPQSSDLEKEVIIRILTKIGRLLLKNAYLRSSFQKFTIQFFIPLLLHQNPLLNSLTCQLLTLYLPLGQLDSQTVASLIQLIYGKITDNQYKVISYNAILAFTALLNHKTARQAAAPHFKQILKIYVDMLSSFEHENLIKCLESIVQHFSIEVIEFAPQLISHLISIFTSFCKQVRPNFQEIEDEPDTINPANAALSTVSQLLSCQLSSQCYYTVSIQLIELFRGIFGKYKNHYDAIISLFNVLVHKATVLADFNYPYVACRILLDGDKNILANSNLPHDIILELRSIEQADDECQQQIVSILKNLIQKMPIQLLQRYPYPVHPQLIFCLIENKKLSMEQISYIPTLQDDKTWSPYIKSYLYLVYGHYAISDPRQIHRVVGLSLFPWLTYSFCPQLVKYVVNAVEEDEEEDDFEAQNTAELMQKYMQEDDEDEEQDDYYEGSGINYSYYYDSPFDCTKDKQILLQKLTSMSQEQALSFSNKLTSKYKKKLQNIVSTI